jgi:4'-phosphopantetheinyl transferase
VSLRPAIATPGVALHVVDLDALRPELGAHESLASPDERSRAAGFRADVHRERFLLRRGALRRLLGSVVGVPPARLRFRAGPLGKPRLEGEGPLFSASSSGSLFVVALSTSLEVGVDVERVLSRDDLDGVARHAFSPVLAARLAALDAEARLPAFYRVWTIEEAVGKLDGRGIADGMPVPDVPLDALLRGGRWALATGDPGRERFVETLALGGEAILSLATERRIVSARSP